MKACPKCQQTNGTDTWLCQCGYEFDGSEPLAAPISPEEPKPRRVLRIVLLAILALPELFIAQNVFLFGAYRLQPGFSQESALILMGEPDAITDYSSSREQNQDWKEWLLAERNTTWAYTVDFCGINLGFFHVQFEDGKAARKSLFIAGHQWGPVILPRNSIPRTLPLPEPSVP